MVIWQLELNAIRVKASCFVLLTRHVGADYNNDYIFN